MTKQDQNRQTSKTDLNLDDLESVSGGITSARQVAINRTT